MPLLESSAVKFGVVFVHDHLLRFSRLTVSDAPVEPLCHSRAEKAERGEARTARARVQGSYAPERRKSGISEAATARVRPWCVPPARPSLPPLPHPTRLTHHPVAQAKESEKKREKARAWYAKTYGQISQGVMLWYFLWRVVWGWGSFGFSATVASVFVYMVNGFCFNAVLAGAASGTSFSTYQDVLFVNWFVMVTASAVSSSFWYTYLVVPGYALFKAGKLFLAWVQTPDPEPSAVMTEAQQKAASKKDRKQKRAEKFQRR